MRTAGSRSLFMHKGWIWVNFLFPSPWMKKENGPTEPRERESTIYISNPGATDKAVLMGTVVWGNLLSGLAWLLWQSLVTQEGFTWGTDRQTNVLFETGWWNAHVHIREKYVLGEKQKGDMHRWSSGYGVAVQPLLAWKRLQSGYSKHIAKRDGQAGVSSVLDTRIFLCSQHWLLIRPPTS